MSLYRYKMYLRFTHKNYLDLKYIVINYHNVLLSKSIQKKVKVDHQTWCGSLNFGNRLISLEQAQKNSKSMNLFLAISKNMNSILVILLDVVGSQVIAFFASILQSYQCPLCSSNIARDLITASTTRVLIPFLQRPRCELETSRWWCPNGWFWWCRFALRPLEEQYRNPPRYWKKGNRVQYCGEQSGRYLVFTIEAEEDYDTGTYKIKAKDDAFLTVDCTLLRPVTHSKPKTKE